VIEQIAHLLEHETAGDPIKDLKWRRRATRKIAQQLRGLKIRVSASTVRRLLKQMGYSLRVNHKKLESGNKNPPPRRVRNQQFAYIERQRKQFLVQGNPIISIDAKKKEMIGNFKNPGAGWERQPQLVMDHDFRSDAKGMAVPYGIYDPTRNQGFVVVGTSYETPASAVDAVTLWWKSYGQRMYGRAKELLILADSGGGNSARSRGWPYHLQQKLVNPHRLTVTVSHYPPGRLEMESYRTPCVLPDQQKLGGPTPEELSNGPQLHSHHHDFDGTEGACSSAAQEVRKRRKDIGSENETPCAVQAQDATEVELHAAANVKLFLRSSLPRARTVPG